LFNGIRQQSKTCQHRNSGSSIVSFDFAALQLDESARELYSTALMFWASSADGGAKIERPLAP
jgi:hypothetical protein